MMLYRLSNEYNWDYGTHPAMLLPNHATIEWLRSVCDSHPVIRHNDFVQWTRDYDIYMSEVGANPNHYIGSMYGATVSISNALLKVLHASGMYTSQQDYYQLCANLNSLAPELEATFVKYLYHNHRSVLDEVGEFSVEAVGTYTPPLMFRTVIALANESDVPKVNAFFADYLSADVLVIGKSALAELVENRRIAGFGGMHRMTLDDDNVIYDNTFIGDSRRFAQRHYAKGFVPSHRMVLDDVEVDLPFDFAPLAWCEDNFIPLIDESDDEIDYASIEFSYSCGYYDSDLKTVHNYTLYDAGDVVTLHSGWTHLREDACYVESRDAWYKDEDCVYSEYAEEYLPRWDAVEHNGEWYPEDADCILRCDECGRRMHEDSDDVYRGGWRVTCCDCAYDCEDSSLYRYGYSTDVLDYTKMLTPHLQIKGKGVYTGIELECYCDHDDHEGLNELTREHLQQARKDVKYVPTEDGSLCDDCGVEFIFKPMSLADMRSEMERFCEEEGSYLSKRKRNGYGLHVHVSSHFLTNLDKIRIQNFVDAHEGFCREIGGRDETDYQRSKSYHRSVKKTEICTDRYGMVNTLPANTIEYRFPRSKPEQQHIMANVELCMAITMYVKYHSSSATQDDASRFYDYILNNYKTYPVLVKLVPLDAQQGNAVYQEFLAKANRKSTFQLNQSI